MSTEKQCAAPYWTAAADGKVVDPVSPVGRIKLSDLMNYDSRATYKHKLVWEFHLSWAHKDYGWTSLASVRTIHSMMLERSPTGKSPLSLHHINLANRDLVEWGYLSELEKGVGRSATRFLPNWDLLKLAAAGQFPVSVTHVGVHNDSVTHVGDRGVTLKVDATANSVTYAGTQRPTYLDPATDGAMVGGVPSGSAMPPAPALGAGSVARGFEELWRAYGVRKGRADAKAAYEALAPSPELHFRLVERAGVWNAAHGGDGIPAKFQPWLHTWLSREKFEEDVPTPREIKKTTDRKGGTPTLPKEQATRASEVMGGKAEITSTDVFVYNEDDRRFDLAEGEEPRELGATSIEVKYRVLDIPSVGEWTDCFCLDEPASAARFAQLVRAVGLEEIRDTDLLHGRQFRAERDGGRMSYLPL